ncbi:MAG: DNA polymerase IV [Marinilabiliales bacterium]|nr:MAG: DNA polymerase IV [Marinilabiliales bacterium]
MDRSIVHIDLDTFFVSVERLLDSRLNNKPVLVGGTNGRGVVAACSYEARRYGIHSAMPMGMAQRLCPEAIVIRGDGGMYSKFSNMVTEIINEESPLYEKSSIDEFYIDVSGMDRFFGTYKWAQELRSKIMKETGLPISFGLSTNKTVAKVGTSEAKPNNHINIPKGYEKDFLAPLAVKKIPMVGDKSYRMLLSMGVKYVKTVQEIPVELMESIMGKNGIVLWKKAQGIDNTPVEPYNERKSISSSITLDKDTIDTRQLKNILTAMAEKLAYQLRNEQKLTSVITVTIRYSDFDTRTRQHRIPYTSLDHTLIKTVMSLFDQLYDRRLLVRLVGVRYSNLISGNYQMNLFEDTSEMINLYQAMDSIRNRFGNTAIRRVSTLGSRIRNGGSPFQGNLSA